MNPTGIEYLTHSWNPVTGCNRDCDKCWARVRAGEIAKSFKVRDIDNKKMIHAYETFSPMIHPTRLDDPMRKTKPCVIGVCFMGDLFDPFWGKVNNAAATAVFQAMFKAPWHTYILLTKQPEIMANYVEEFWGDVIKPSNIFLGASARNNREYNHAAYYLKKLHEAGWKTWFSLEPWSGKLIMEYDAQDGVILGSMSGSEHPPPLTEEDARFVAKECRIFGVPFMYKQGPNPDKPKYPVHLPSIDGVRHKALAWRMPE